jgi:hypothetical protein
MDEELQLMAKHGQRLRGLLAAGRENVFAGHPEFKEVQRAVLGEVEAQVIGAESWLEKVRADLYAAAVVTRRTRAVDTRRAGAEVTGVALRVFLDRQPPSQEASVRYLVQPTTE